MKITDDMLTEWFPSDVDPIREGQYEIRYYEGGPFRMMEYRSGHWYFESDLDGEEIESAFGVRGGCSSIALGEAWRGLKEKHHG